MATERPAPRDPVAFARGGDAGLADPGGGEGGLQGGGLAGGVVQVALAAVKAACPEAARLVDALSDAAFNYAGGAHTAGTASGARAEARRRAIVAT
jgi:hypothetical protein